MRLLVAVVACTLCVACAATPAKEQPRDTTRRDTASHVAEAKNPPYLPTWIARRGRWVLFELGGDGQVYWMDTVSVATRNDRVEMWVGSATKNQSVTSSSPRFHDLELYAADCGERTIQALEHIKYSRNGEVIGRWTQPEPATHAAPESIGESIVSAGCNPNKALPFPFRDSISP